MNVIGNFISTPFGQEMLDTLLLARFKPYSRTPLNTRKHECIICFTTELTLSWNDCYVIRNYGNIIINYHNIILNCRNIIICYYNLIINYFKKWLLIETITILIISSIGVYFSWINLISNLFQLQIKYKNICGLEFFSGQEVIFKNDKFCTLKPLWCVQETCFKCK